MRKRGSSGGEPQRGRALVAVVLLAALLGAGVAAFWRLGKRESPTRVAFVESNGNEPVDTSGYVGDRACAECHPGESAAHAGSGHSHTLTKATQSPWATRLDGRTLQDPEHPGVTWTIHGSEGSFEIARTENGKTEKLPVEYVFGSGKHGLSFLSTQPGETPDGDPKALEHHISYFAPEDRLSITTGQENTPDTVNSPGRTVLTPHGRILEEGTTKRCFDCHATITSTRGYSHFDTRSLIGNVTCERCHGPAREHVASAKRGETPALLSFGFETLDPDVEVRMCGSCHRYMKNMAPLALNPSNLAIVRFQPVGLMMSRCFVSGLGGIRCSTCHDPHARPSTDMATYDAQCIKCHSPGAKRVCTSKPTPHDGCAGCHMPKRKIPEGFVFTDHWIRKPNDTGRMGPMLRPPPTSIDTEEIEIPPKPKP